MSESGRLSSLLHALIVMSPICLSSPNASAATSQFKGVNWADQRDNFQSGVLYIAGLSASDTYSSASAIGEAVMSQFASKIGANAVRVPINEATVSSYWSTYTGAIDAVLSKGMVVLCYWDSAKSNKPSDMNAFWNMWKTVVTKYGGNDNAYFEIFNEPNMYSKADLVSLYSSWLTQFPTVPKNRVILDGTGNAQNVSDIGSAAALDGCLLGVHDYSFFGSDTWTSESQWISQFKGEVGSYSDRTVCTEWGGPMSPGSKNGVSYGSLDYSAAPTNYFEAYIRGMSSRAALLEHGQFLLGRPQRRRLVQHDDEEWKRCRHHAVHSQPVGIGATEEFMDQPNGKWRCRGRRWQQRGRRDRPRWRRRRIWGRNWDFFWRDDRKHCGQYGCRWHGWYWHRSRRQRWHIDLGCRGEWRGSRDQQHNEWQRRSRRDDGCGERRHDRCCGRQLGGGRWQQFE
jgi:hypothetical protein